MVSSLIDTCDGKASQNRVALVYVVFLGIAGLVYHLIAEGEFSSVLTLSAIFQCLAFSLLALQMLSSQNSSGRHLSKKLDVGCICSCMPPLFDSLA